MTDDGVALVIRQAIGGDAGAIAWISAQSDTTATAAIVAMAALLERNPGRLESARAVAATRRDRQLVAIAMAHLGGDRDLVDALAREHLVDYPDSLIVAWIAADSVTRSGPAARR